MPWKIIKTTHHHWLPDDYKDEITFCLEHPKQTRIRVNFLGSQKEFKKWLLLKNIKFV